MQVQVRSSRDGCTVQYSYSINCDVREELLAQMWELQELRRVARWKHALHQVGLELDRILERLLDAREDVLR